MYKLPMNKFGAACGIPARGGDTTVVCLTRRGDFRGNTSKASSANWSSGYDLLGYIYINRVQCPREVVGSVNKM